MTDSFKKRLIFSGDEIAKPTNEKFSTEQWQNEFSLIASPTTEDQHLYDAGLWFAPYFKNLHDKQSLLNRLVEKIDDAHPDDLIRFLIGTINFECNRIQNQHSVIDKKLISSVDSRESVGKIEATISAFNSTLSKVINQAKKITQRVSYPTKINFPRIESWLNQTQYLAVQNNNFKYLWSKCLLQDWYIDKSDTKFDTMCAANKEAEATDTVSIYWREFIQKSKTTRWHEEWLKIPKQIRAILYYQPRSISIKPINQMGEVELEFSNDLKDLRLIPHQNLVILFLKENPYIRDLINEPLPKLLYITLEQILKGWQMISSIVDSIEKKIKFDKISNEEDLLLCSPVFSKANLVKLMQDELSITSEQAIKIIELITFREEQENAKYYDDLWERPLVKVNEDQLTIIIKALKVPELSRFVRKWLEEGGLTKVNDKIGKAFEGYVRKELQQCNQLKNVEIYSQNFKYKDENSNLQLEKGDIDLIIKIDNTLIVGEIKCLKTPAESMDFYYYDNELLKAARQAIKSQNYINYKFEKFLKKTRLVLNKDQLKILPLIIVSDGARGIGSKIQNVPVVDLFILQNYLASNRMWISTFQLKEKKIEKNILQEEYFYFSEKEAEDLIENYLAQPPHLKKFLKHLRYKDEPLPTTKPAIYRSLFIDDIDWS